MQAEQRSHLQRVQSNGNHLHQLLNDLLDLSRIEAGGLTIESMACNLYPLLYDVLSAMQSRAIAKDLKLSLRIANSIPEQIMTDPTRLRQILTNLIGNAIKFTAEGSVDLIVDTEAIANKLRIRVQDTGPGIEVSAQKDVFEPFKQADETVARKFGGTGLGLPISRKLAKALGGDIELASEPGFGSTFTVTIATGPLDGVKLLSAQEAEATLTAPNSDAQLNLSLAGFRILIVDDVEANREFFSFVLERSEAECLFATNGQEAVDALQNEEVHLVLMDMQMPVMDGYTATQVLRAEGVDIPIVAITANGTDADRQRCHEAGCSGYLTKPISMAGLLRGVAEYLGVSPDQTLPDQTLDADPVQTQRPATVPSARQPAIHSSSNTRSEFSLPADPVFREFATRFVVKVQSAIPALNLAIEHSDGATLAKQGHWLKGTGGMVGLPVLTEVGLNCSERPRPAISMQPESSASNWSPSLTC